MLDIFSICPDRGHICRTPAVCAVDKKREQNQFSLQKKNQSSWAEDASTALSSFKGRWFPCFASFLGSYCASCLQQEALKAEYIRQLETQQSQQQLQQQQSQQQYMPPDFAQQQAYQQQLYQQQQQLQQYQVRHFYCYRPFANSSFSRLECFVLLLQFSPLDLFRGRGVHPLVSFTVGMIISSRRYAPACCDVCVVQRNKKTNNEKTNSLTEHRQKVFSRGSGWVQVKTLTVNYAMQSR